MKLLLLLSILMVGSLQAQVHDTSWKDLIRNKQDAWFQTQKAKQIAENVLLYQFDIGGWPKNIQMHHPLTDLEKQEVLKRKKTNQGATTDNGATIQELLFLSKMYGQTQKEIYKISFLKGLDYLLEAQYDYGGWPQYYPLREGYYSHITYNDDSMINIMELLRELKEDTGYYAIKPSQTTLEKVTAAYDKGIDCILKTQYKQNGTLTAWCAQHDTLTLLPAKARAYELPSLSGYESVNIVRLLMSIEEPSEEVITAVKSAVSWFQKVKIDGLREVRVYDQGKVISKKMVQDTSAPAIWARFMTLEDNTPFFCDRDGIKKWTLKDIGEERRNGYGWYKQEPQIVLDNYERWLHRVDNQSSKRSSDLYDMIVSKDGSGDYNSIQEAINNAKSFPYDKITIFIKNGVYKEKVKIHEWNPNLILVGESRDNTVITYNDSFNKIGKGRNSTFYTYTLLVEAHNVVLKNLTIKNSAGPVGQAVALSVFSDEVAVVNCKILGNQDTLYASGKGRQYYKDCYIEGTTDFIFGSATAFFENCEIHLKKDSYITAASTPKEARYGYVFKNCKITSDNAFAKAYLGRPWRKYAKTVFVHCDLGNYIRSEGWHNWSKTEAEQTAFYAEYQNYGVNFSPEERVPWSHQLTKKEAEKYTLKKVLGKSGSQEKKEWYESL